MTVTPFERHEPETASLVGSLRGPTSLAGGRSLVPPTRFCPTRSGTTCRACVRVNGGQSVRHFRRRGSRR